MTPAAERRLVELLARPRYEVLPLEGIVETVAAAVPRDVKLTVTVSPTKGLEPTLEVAGALAAEGYAVVPHLSARLVRDRAHLEELVARLRELGATEIFAVAGDAEQPAGAFEGAADLLDALAGLEHPFREIGITGYPESHPLISDETTIEAMFAKARHATLIASQLCFDPRVTTTWIENVWARGTRLPIHVGIPGVVSTARLLRISARIGIGDSTRFLRKNGSRLVRMVRPGAYRPDGLIRGLEPALADPDRKLAGFHVFTFNDVVATEAWRRARLDRLRAKLGLEEGSDVTARV